MNADCSCQSCRDSRMVDQLSFALLAVVTVLALWGAFVWILSL